MINQDDNRVKILLDLGLEEEANKLCSFVSSDEQDSFLFGLVKKYLKLFNFDFAITLSKTIQNQELKEFSFQLILKVYLRNYLTTLNNQEIDNNLIQRIRKNIRRINEKSLPKLNQRIKVINLILAEDIDQTSTVIERIIKRDCYLAVTILIDIFNLGNPGYRLLFELLRRSKNNELRQSCYHLFRHQGGHKTQEKIKQYKSETTIIMINGEENYTFKKLKNKDKIIYERLTDWEQYKIPDILINQGKIVHRETIRQIFLPYSFIVFCQPNHRLLQEIKKDPFLNKIPIIYPESNYVQETRVALNKDKLIKPYRPSLKYLEQVSGQELEELKKQGLDGDILEAKIAEMDHNISLFIEDMLTQI